MKIIAMIPARLAASRFPGKPLKKILGLEMIEHVRRRVLLCDWIDSVYVATCDNQIKELVESSGGKAIMTADNHERCTDRIAEAARKIEADIVINVQGDEPLVMPEMLEAVVRPFREERFDAVNLVSPITEDKEFNDPNAPKVVTDVKGNILYISREPIPSVQKAVSNRYKKLKQLGLIAFRYDFLQTFAGLPATPLEEVESVDMMRAIEHGYRVRAVEVKGKMIGVDMPGDIERVEKIMADDPLMPQYNRI